MTKKQICPHCGLKFINLSKHKCKKQPKEEKINTKKKIKSTKKTKTPEKKKSTKKKSTI
ncbi:hypothetical protein ES703_06633 [subsurface metagenome]